MPAGWKQLPAKEMRYATLVLDGEPSLEMSVTQFPTRPEMPISEQVVANINRWRNQLALPPIEEDDLAEADGKTDFGQFRRVLDRHHRTPAAEAEGNAAAASGGIVQTGTRTRRGSRGSGPVFDKPDGWIEGISKRSLRSCRCKPSTAIPR